MRSVLVLSFLAVGYGAVINSQEDLLEDILEEPDETENGARVPRQAQLLPESPQEAQIIDEVGYQNYMGKVLGPQMMRSSQYNPGNQPNSARKSSEPFPPNQQYNSAYFPPYMTGYVPPYGRAADSMYSPYVSEYRYTSPHGMKSNMQAYAPAMQSEYAPQNYAPAYGRSSVQYSQYAPAYTPQDNMRSARLLQNLLPSKSFSLNKAIQPPAPVKKPVFQETYTVIERPIISDPCPIYVGKPQLHGRSAEYHYPAMGYSGYSLPSYPANPYDNPAYIADAIDPVYYM